MPCFIMYAQIVVIELYLTNVGNLPARVIFSDNGDLRLDMKIILTLYGIFNLDFFH